VDENENRNGNFMFEKKTSNLATYYPTLQAFETLEGFCFLKIEV
jgi:hypothetical protein